MCEATVRDIRQMGITHADFFRLLPRAIGEHHYQVDGNIVRVTLPAGTATISLGEEQERRLSANVIMPHTEVIFEYSAVPESMRAEFEQHFHMRYMRGLG